MSTLLGTPLPINSTIVRISGQLAQISLRTYFGTLSRLLPHRAGHHAERLFTTPPRHRARYPLPATARRETVLSEAGHLAVWQAGPGDAPAVLLVHGWGGVGSQLGPFVAPLLRAGFRVIWFDQPGHGESEGRQVALPDLVSALAAMHATHGPFHAAIGHSLGAAAIGLSLRQGHEYGRIVLIGTPASIGEHMRNFARRLGLNDRVRNAVREQVERSYATRFEDIDRIEELRRADIRALLIHDAGDRHVAYADSERIASHLVGAHLIRTFGLGHFRILRDPAVIAVATRFIAAANARLPDNIPELPVPAPLL